MKKLIERWGSGSGYRRWYAPRNASIAHLLRFLNVAATMTGVITTVKVPSSARVKPERPASVDLIGLAFIMGLLGVTS